VNILTIVVVSPCIIVMFGCATKPPPVIIQQPPPPKKQIVIPDDPMVGLRPDVQTAIKSGNYQTLVDNLTVLYPYSPDVQWTVDCAPMHAIEIRLAPDEVTDENSVILGDPRRWSVKVSRQAVLVEPAGDFGYVDPTSKQKVPADPNMISTLTIFTSKRRSYNYLLRMRTQSAVLFHGRRQKIVAIESYYPAEVKQAQTARELALKEAAKEGQQ
jgi:Conjugal transfer protein